MRIIKLIGFIFGVLILLSAILSWHEIYLDSYYLNRKTARTSGYILKRDIQGDKFGHDIVLYYLADSVAVLSRFKVQKEDLSIYFLRRKVDVKYSVEHPSSNRIIFFNEKSENMDRGVHNELLKLISD